jgi:hypothetical protein
MEFVILSSNVIPAVMTLRSDLVMFDYSTILTFYSFVSVCPCG